LDADDLFTPHGDPHGTGIGAIMGAGGIQHPGLKLKLTHAEIMSQQYGH
jgi:hypothetical protein